MPNPFTQYTGEQVQQINILPYTAGIANSLQQGISDLGKGIGEAIKGYRANQQEGDMQNAYLAQSIAEYTKDVPLDDSAENYEGPDAGQVTGEIEIDPTAPAHLVKLFKKLNTGNGDWASNLANLSSDDRQEAFNNHRIWEVNDKKKFDRRIAETSATAEADYKKAMATKALWDAKLDEVKYNRAQYEQDLLSTGELPEDQRSVTHTYIGSETQSSGTIVNSKTGATQEDVDFNDIASTLGISKNDFITEEQQAERVKSLEAQDFITTARLLSGVKSFDPSQPIGNQPSDRITFPDGRTETAPMRFIRRTYESALASASNPDTIKSMFLGIRDEKGKTTKGNYKDLDSVPDRQRLFETAKKVANTNQVIGSLKNAKDSKGNALFTDYVRENDLPEKWVIKSGTRKDYQVPVKKSEVVTMSDVDVQRERIDRINSIYTRQGKKIPLNIQEALAVVGLANVGTRVYSPVTGQSATLVGDVKTGILVPDSQMGAFMNKGANLGPTKELTTAGMNYKSVNNYLTVNFSKPVSVGNGKAIFFKGNVENFAGGISEKTTTELNESVTAVQRINSIADEMKAMTLNANWFEKHLPAWENKYESLNLNAQTMRSWFIAKGQETDKDNTRLEKILAWQGEYLKLNPKLAVELIENFRGIVEGSVLGNLQRSGFTVTGLKQGGPSDFKSMVDAMEARAIKAGYKIPKD